MPWPAPRASTRVQGSAIPAGAAPSTRQSGSASRISARLMGLPAIPDGGYCWGRKPFWPSCRGVAIDESDRDARDRRTGCAPGCGAPAPRAYRADGHPGAAHGGRRQPGGHQDPPARTPDPRWATRGARLRRVRCRRSGRGGCDALQAGRRGLVLPRRTGGTRRQLRPVHRTGSSARPSQTAEHRLRRGWSGAPRAAHRLGGPRTTAPAFPRVKRS